MREMGNNHFTKTINSFYRFFFHSFFFLRSIIILTARLKHWGWIERNKVQIVIVFCLSERNIIQLLLLNNSTHMYPPTPQVFSYDVCP